VRSFHPSACGNGGGCSFGVQSVRCWRFAPQCCAWRSVSWRRRVRQLESTHRRLGIRVNSFAPSRHTQAGMAVPHPSQPSRSNLGSGGKVRGVLRVCRQWAVPTRDAQPFNREDKQRRVKLYCFYQRTAAVVCLSSQTLGLTKSEAHAIASDTRVCGPSRSARRCSLLGELCLSA